MTKTRDCSSSLCVSGEGGNEWECLSVFFSWRLCRPSNLSPCEICAPGGKATTRKHLYVVTLTSRRVAALQPSSGVKRPDLHATHSVSLRGLVWQGGCHITGLNWWHTSYTHPQWDTACKTHTHKRKRERDLARWWRALMSHFVLSKV